MSDGMGPGLRLLASLRFGWISALRFSPAGDMLAMAGGDGIAVYRQAFGGAPSYRLKGHSAPVKSIAFSPDGSLLASGSADTGIKLWRLGQAARSWQGEQGAVNALRFVNGARLASGGGDGSLCIWDSETGRLQSRRASHDDEVTALAYDPRGSVLYSGGRDRRLLAWHLDTGAVAVHGEVEGWVRDLAWLGRRRELVAASRDGVITRWSEAGDKLAMPAHAGGVDALAVSPDGQWLASGGRDRMIRLWQLDSGRELAAAPAHDKPVLALDFHPRRALLVSGGGDNLVKLWALA